MSRRPLSLAELAVHFGLEPIEVEWLLDSFEAGTSDAELRRAIESLDCTPDEARRLVLHIRDAVEAGRRPV